MAVGATIGGAMLIATFGPATGWVGKTITYDDGHFALEGEGNIRPADVMEYDRQGFLEWATPGSRAFVGAQAQKAEGPPPVKVGVAAATRGPAKDSSGRPSSSDSRTEGQKVASILGLLLLVVGLGVAIYFAAVFDVSVPVTYPNGTGYGLPDRVNNIGLMSDRQNGIIFGFAAAIAGGVLMVVGRKRTHPQAVSSFMVAAPAKGTCDACGGSIDVGIFFCPHCGQRLSWTTGSLPPAST